MLYGSTTRNRPSRFWEDIPPELTEVHENRQRYAASRSFSDVYKRQADAHP